MSSYHPVNSALRSLDILVVLNRQQVCTVDHIHRQTDLPKPTIVRFLETLIEAGYVAKEEWNKGYRVTSQVASLSCGFHGGPMVVEAGRSWAMALTRVHKWPASIAVPDGNAVRICHTTASDAAISPYHAIINKRMGLVSKALGRAYLSFCPSEEQRLALQLLQTTEHPDSEFMTAPSMVERLIQKDRNQGFAERMPLAVPEASSSVAVPIYDPNSTKIIATIGLTYYASAVSRRQIVETYVPQLHAASKAITDSITEIKDAFEVERAAVA